MFALVLCQSDNGSALDGTDDGYVEETPEPQPPRTPSPVYETRKVTRPRVEMCLQRFPDDIEELRSCFFIKPGGERVPRVSRQAQGTLHVVVWV